MTFNCKGPISTALQRLWIRILLSPNVFFQVDKTTKTYSKSGVLVSQSGVLVL